MESIVLTERVEGEGTTKKSRAYSANEIEAMVEQYGNMVFRLAFF